MVIEGIVYAGACTTAVCALLVSFCFVRLIYDMGCPVAAIFEDLSQDQCFVSGLNARN